MGYPCQRIEDFGWLDHAAGAFVATCEGAFCGAKESAAVCFELADVALGGGMLPHFAIHGGRDKDGSGARQGEIGGGKGIRCEAMGEAAEDIGSGRGHEEEIRLVGEFDMTRFPGLFFVFQRDEDCVAGKCLEREGGDELGGGAGHHRMDAVAGLGEARGEFCGLVGGDGAGDTEDDVHGGEWIRWKAKEWVRFVGRR